jgi:hypothetical protein
VKEPVDGVCVDDQLQTQEVLVDDQITHVVLNPVAVDRADDFERFLLETVVPAVHAQRPDLEGRWRCLRSTGPEPADTGVVTYVFLFEGGDLEEDWALEKLLPPHYGAEKSEQLLEEWLDTLAPRERWLAALGGSDEEQVVWSTAPVAARSSSTRS